MYICAPEKAMTPHSSTLAWKIPWMEKPGRLHAVHEVAKSQTRLSNLTFTFHFHALEKKMTTVLEKEMATHSSVLAWRIPGMGEPGELLSMGSHRVGHDWSDLAAAYMRTFFPWELLIKHLPHTTAKDYLKDKKNYPCTYNFEYLNKILN